MVTCEVVLDVSAYLIHGRRVIVHHDDLSAPKVKQPALARVPAIGVRVSMQLDVLDIGKHPASREAPLVFPSVIDDAAIAASEPLTKLRRERLMWFG